MLEELTLIKDWSYTLRLSKTQMQTYLICPRKFFFQYVAGAEPEFTPPNLPFGKAIHETVGSFYRHMQVGNPKPDIDWLLDDWRMTWTVAATSVTCR